MPIDWTVTECHLVPRKDRRWPSKSLRVLRICDKCGDRKFIGKGNAQRMKTPIMCDACRRKVRGPEHPHWRGGHRVGPYKVVSIGPDDPFFGMAFRIGRNRTGQVRQILEHRLIMARHLGRPLEKGEHVHHINGDGHDNRIENLQLVTAQANIAAGALQREVNRLRRHIASCCGHTV